MRGLFVIAIFCFLLFSCESKNPQTYLKTAGIGHVGDLNSPAYTTWWVDNERKFDGPVANFTCAFTDGFQMYYGGRNATDGPDKQPAFWADESVTVLSDSGSVEAIFVLDGTIYSSGYVIENGVKTPVFWTATTPTVLESIAHVQTKAIYVYQADVYVAGYDGDETVYWKNGAERSLSLKMIVSGMFVTENDVHLVGQRGGIAVHCRNGNCDELRLPQGAMSSSANSILIDGSDVYIAGNVPGSGASVATYWKNGTLTTLPDGTRAVSIATLHSDVYILGYKSNPGTTFDIPVYWKNGEQRQLDVENNRPYQVFHCATYQQLEE